MEGKYETYLNPYTMSHELSTKATSSEQGRVRAKVSLVSFLPALLRLDGLKCKHHWGFLAVTFTLFSILHLLFFICSLLSVSHVSFFLEQFILDI